MAYPPHQSIRAKLNKLVQRHRHYSREAQVRRIHNRSHRSSTICFLLGSREKREGKDFTEGRVGAKSLNLHLIRRIGFPM